MKYLFFSMLMIILISNTLFGGIIRERYLLPDSSFQFNAWGVRLIDENGFYLAGIFSNYKVPKGTVKNTFIAHFNKDFEEQWHLFIGDTKTVFPVELQNAQTHLNFYGIWAGFTYFNEYALQVPICIEISNNGEFVKANLDTVSKQTNFINEYWCPLIKFDDYLYNIIGTTITSGKPNKLMIKKYDISCSFLWEKYVDFEEIGDTEYNIIPVRAISRNNGEIVVIGTIRFLDDGIRQLFIAKISQEGVPIKIEIFEDNYDKNLLDAINIDNDNIVLLGNYSQSSLDKPCFIKKFDEKLQLVWEENYGFHTRDQLNKLIKTDDNGYAACGYSYDESTSKKYQFYVIRTDSMGKLKDEFKWGLSDEINTLQDISILQNGNFLVTGLGTYRDVYIAEISLSPVSVQEEPINNVFSLSPNPAADYIEINLDRWTPTDRWSPSYIQIYNTLGECVISDVPHLKRIDVSRLPAGLYYLRIGSAGKMFVKM